MDEIEIEGQLVTRNMSSKRRPLRSLQKSQLRIEQHVEAQQGPRTPVSLV